MLRTAPASGRHRRRAWVSARSQVQAHHVARRAGARRRPGRQRGERGCAGRPVGVPFAMPWLHTALSGALYTAITRAPAVKASAPAERGDQVAGAHGNLPSAATLWRTGRDVGPALCGFAPARPSLPVGTASAVRARRHVHAHALRPPWRVEPRAHGVDEPHRIGVVGGKAWPGPQQRGASTGRRRPWRRRPLPGGGAVLQHALGDLGPPWLDGDGAAADQGHDRRGAGLALGRWASSSATMSQ